MTISGDMASLVGFACEAFLYGCYTILFAMAIYLKLNGPDHPRGVNKPLFIITVLLYLSCSTHFIMGFIHFYKTLNTTGIEGYADIKNTLIVACFLVVVAEFLGDLILIYRCWVLWSKNYWVTILPTLATFAGAVCGTVTVYLLLCTNKTVEPASLVQWGLSALIVLLCGNAFVTTLIIARIWYLSPRKRRDVLGASFPIGIGWTAIVITIESGLLYLVVQIIYSVVFTIRHPSLHIINDIAVQIYGIAPTLIFIRMSDLLNTPPSGLSRSGAVSAPRPVSTKLAFTHSTTTSTDPGLTIELRSSQIEWKPSGGDLGSNLSFVDSNIIV